MHGIKEENPISTPHFEEDTSSIASLSYVNFFFMIFIYLCFTSLMYFWMRNYRKRQRKVAAASMVKRYLTYKKEECEKLNEVRKILRKLNRQLAPPSKIPRYQALYSAKYRRKNVLPTRSQLSDVSSQKNVERKPSSEELRQDIQIALYLLEEKITNGKSNRSEIRKYQKTDSPATKLHIHDDEQPVHEDRWNEEDYAVEMEQGEEEDWTGNFENEESILSPQNEINEMKVLSNLEENEDMEAYEEYSKHGVLPASHSDKFYSYSNHSLRDREKQRLSSKSSFSNSSLLPNSKNNLSSEYMKDDLRSPLEFLDKKTKNDKFVTDDNVKYHQKGSSRWFDRNDRIFYEFIENKRNKISTKSNRLNSKMNQNMKDGQEKYLKGNEFVTLSEVNNNGQRSSIHSEIRNEDIEPCKEHANKKESLSVLQYPVNPKELMRRALKEFEEIQLLYHSIKKQ